MIDIVIDKDKISSIDLTPLNKYVEWNKTHSKYFLLDAGSEHYKLIAYIAGFIPKYSYLIDIGTYYGFSSLALAKDYDKNIITYDIYDHIPDDTHINTIKKHPNIDFRICDCLNEIDTLIKSEFIVLDIDPHNGVQEKEILNALLENDYKGIVLLDDIHLNENMKEMWNSISQKKYDLTSYGHHSGTGLVVFDKSRYNIIIK